MAARAKKSRRKSGGKTASKRSVSKRSSAKRSGKKDSTAKRGATKKSTKRPAIKKSAAKRPAIKKGAAKRSGGVTRSSGGSRKAASQSPMARVTRVAKEVAQQASTAVTEGLETVKEFSGSIVDRVTG
jgi:histone H1/5